MIEGEFHYVAAGERPFLYTYPPPPGEPQRGGRFVTHRFPVADARALGEPPALDREGFALREYPTEVSDFYDEGEIARRYYPEMEALVLAETGAARVLVFDHTWRANSPELRRRLGIREPVRVVHNDYTPRSGPQRVRDLLGGEAEAALARRYAFINVWRPINGPVLEAPLGVCDARSVRPEQWIENEMRYPDRKGETYVAQWDGAHRWYYYPRMKSSEVLLIKCYDSATDGRARFSAHSAFDDPTAPADAPKRESIEIRTIAFY
jgi:hypothetical protein